MDSDTFALLTIFLGCVGIAYAIALLVGVFSIRKAVRQLAQDRVVLEAAGKPAKPWGQVSDV